MVARRVRTFCMACDKSLPRRIVARRVSEGLNPCSRCGLRRWIQNVGERGTSFHQSPIHLLLAVVACTALTTTGCDNNPFPQQKVSGKITYQDGEVIPAERIRIWFKSQAPALDERTHPRPASALVNVSDGTFEGATTYKYLDGLVRGEHHVFIDITPEDLVPAEYTKLSSSPLRISTADSPLHIQLPRP